MLITAQTLPCLFTVLSPLGTYVWRFDAFVSPLVKMEAKVLYKHQIIFKKSQNSQNYAINTASI